MPTLTELNESLAELKADLSLLTEKDEPTAADADAAEKLSGRIDEAEAAIKAAVDRKARMAEHRSRADAAHAFQTEPASKGVPFAGRIDAAAAEADKSKSLNDWLKCVGTVGSTKAPAQHRQAAEDRLDRVYKAGFNSWANVKAALSEQTGITGGYTAPPEYSNELLKVGIEDSLVASRARQLAMGSAELHIPALDQTTAPSAGQTAFTGGMVAYWTGEAATRTETEPKFKQVTLRANELSGFTVASRNVLADNTTALESMLQMLIRDTVSWYVDYGCLQGDGVAKPLGILNAPATIPVTRATATTIKLADTTGMMAKLMPKSRGSAIWVAAIDTFAQIVTLVNSAGNPTYLPNVGTGYGAADLTGATLPLHGRPVYFTEKLPALGTKGDLMLIDPSYYLLGMRQQLEIAASDAPGFTKNQMYWRFVARVDGQPWVDKPFTLQDGTRTVSPFVVLN